MKRYILVDDNKIVRCIASKECNLHTNKLHMKKYHVEAGGTVGDAYDSKKKKWISHPENYPKPSETEINEQKIRKEIIKITRKQAIENLKASNELPQDYEGKI